VEILPRAAGALLEGLHDTQTLVGPAGEVQVCLELADNPVAAPCAVPRAITVPSSSLILREIVPSKAVP
jgi:hypothetical protein